MSVFFFQRKNADQKLVKAESDSMLATDDSLVEDLKDHHKRETAKVARSVLFLLPDANLEEKTSQEVANAIDCLVVASEQFSVPELCKEAVVLAMDAIEKKSCHSLACLALVELHPEVLEDSEAETLARDTIRKNPEILLDNEESLTLLSELGIETVINDVETDEFTRFQILEAWSKTDELRPSIAAQLINHISLESIDTAHLVTTVERSGLVTKDQLYEAYKAQAKRKNADNCFQSTPGYKTSDNVNDAKRSPDYVICDTNIYSCTNSENTVICDTNSESAEGDQIGGDSMSATINSGKKTTALGELFESDPAAVP
mmetsp:Transcript_28925/g.42667  ORF Transcript_28925/g.42667 Transcript_28925/m.42667 type:complete len:317 (-) Transcript_28925:34-984(-)